jgi:heat shock protein HslJ
MKHALPIFFASVLTITAVLANGVMALGGSEWGLGADDSNGVMVKFEADGRVWGKLGCNRFSGSYEQEGATLTFGLLAMTRMACSEEKMKTEDSLSAHFRATRRAEISHLTLVLLDGEGRELVRLQRRDFD